MPVFPNLTPPSSITLQQVVDYARSFPENNPILPAGGYNYEPALTFANDVLQKILMQGMNWRWNESYVPLFITNCLQQDYVTSLTDIGWLTSAFRIDVNNNTNAGNLSPKPIATLEVSRDLGISPYPSLPVEVCFINNSQAQFGVWTPETVIPCGYGVAAAPATPIQQIVDANSNILFIDSSVLNLSINSPGFNTTPITLPDPNPYGTTGTDAPVLPPASKPGTTILDGTVTWTVADPNGYAIRLNPLPGMGGLCWLMQIVYQRKAPRFRTLQDTISPVPDDYSYLFREGFLAKCYDHVSSPKAPGQYAKWHEQIEQALRASTREITEFGMYPDTGMAGGSVIGPSIPIGPSSPYNTYGWGSF